MSDILKTVIVNVNYFDGYEMIKDPHNIYIQDGIITKIEPYQSIFNFIKLQQEHGWVPVFGDGAFLIPGLIDSHVHVLGVEELKQCCSYGVTTCMDMGCFPLQLLTALRRVAGHDGLPDIRSAGMAAATRTKNWPTEGIVQGPESAKIFVEAQVSQGSDYCKVIMDPDVPSSGDGPPMFTAFKGDTLQTLVQSAHQNNKKVIAHAAALKPFQDAITYEMDIITHVPMNEVLSVADASKMRKIVAVPTLCMMKSILEKNPRKGHSYDNAAASVKSMFDVKVEILVGTDSNNIQHVPGHPIHGESMHREMELILAATNMNPIDILRGATSKPAKVFGLEDRGVIQVNKRADLVLLAGNPLENIQNTRMISQVWAKGIPYLPVRLTNLTPTVSWGQLMQINDISASAVPSWSAIAALKANENRSSC